MARPLRLEYPGAVYHLTVRGNERKDIFHRDEDRLTFLKIIREAKQRYGLRVYVYVLMNNHYHLVIETTDGNLTGAMHFINTRYSLYFNRKYSRVGHLFQGRYKSLLVDKDNYLLELSRYVHLNPVRAGLVRQLEDYEWTSYQEYLGRGRMKITETEEILSHFRHEREEAVRRYQGFVAEAKGIEIGFIKKNVYGQLILGSKEFTRTIKAKLQSKVLSEEIPYRSKIMVRKSVDRIIDVVAKGERISPEELVKKRGKWNPGKKIAIYLVWKHTDMRINRIAHLFGGMHYSSVSKTVKRMDEEVKQNERLRLKIEQLENQI